MKSFKLFAVARFTAKEELKQKPLFKTLFLFSLIAVFSLIFSFVIPLNSSEKSPFEVIYILNSTELELNIPSESESHTFDFSVPTKEKGIEKARNSQKVAFIHIYNEGNNYFSNIYTDNPSVEWIKNVSNQMETEIKKEALKKDGASSELYNSVFKARTLNVLPEEQFNMVKKEMPQNSFFAFNINCLVSLAVISLTSFTVLNTVSEEKSSKLSEALFLYVPPTTLLGGKLLGILASVLLNFLPIIICFASLHIFSFSTGENTVFRQIFDYLKNNDISFFALFCFYICIFFFFAFFVCSFKSNYISKLETKSPDITATLIGAVCYAVSAYIFNYGSESFNIIGCFTPFISLFYAPSAHITGELSVQTLWASLGVNLIYTVVFGAFVFQKHKRMLKKEGGN